VHSTRRELLYLTDIVEAAEAIASFIQGQDRDSFVGNDLVRSAILQKLQVIGEAAAHVGDATGVREQRTTAPGICLGSIPPAGASTTM